MPREKSEFILELQKLRPNCLQGQAAMNALDLQLQAGELMRLRVEPGNEQLPLVDAALGLTPPLEGRACCMGDDWQNIGPAAALYRRGRIGRVFDWDGWVSNLDVIENITLAQRHHTKRPVPEILAEADSLARKFGLKGVPHGRPAAIPHRDLRRAEWVRAFMGQPDLICLERPALGVADNYIDALADAGRQVCSRGGAVIWIAADEREWSATNGQNTRDYKMQGANMVALEENNI